MCGQALLGRGVSRTKQDSHTRVPSFSVKSTLRVGSISASHLPQSSVCAGRISPLNRLDDARLCQLGAAPTLAARPAKLPSRPASSFAHRLKPACRVTYGCELHLPLP